MKINLEKYIDNEELNRFVSMKDEINKLYSIRIKINANSNFGVSGNTYRVFRGLPKKPSNVFRKWAFDIVKDDVFLEEVALITNKIEFSVIHVKYASLLDKYWKYEQGVELSLAHRNKLIDLFFKFVAKCNLSNEAINNNIIAFANIPVDSKTLLGLNKMYNGILLNDKISMGVIKTKYAYDYIQELVLLLSEKTNMPALYFDYFSFNVDNSNNFDKGIQLSF